MRSARRFLVLVVVAAAALTGCNASASLSAATVDGTTITQSQLNSTLNAIANNKVYRCVIEQSSSAALDGAGTGTYAKAFSASVLTLMVSERIFTSYVDQLGLDKTAYARSIATHELEASLAQGTAATNCHTTGPAVVASFDPALRSVLESYWTDLFLLAAHHAGVQLTPAGLAAYARANPEATDKACVSEILVKQRSLANSVIAQFHSGTSFAALARTHSVDPTSASTGGGIGCDALGAFPVVYAAVLAHLPTGKISAPISVAGYYAVLIVTSRTPVAGSDAAAALLTAVGPSLEHVNLRREKHSKVTIDPYYGSWKLVKGSLVVKPPSGPPAVAVPNPSAVTPKPTS